MLEIVHFTPAAGAAHSAVGETAVVPTGEEWPAGAKKERGASARMRGSRGRILAVGNGSLPLVGLRCTRIVSSSGYHEALTLCGAEGSGSEVSFTEIYLTIANRFHSPSWQDPGPRHDKVAYVVYEAWQPGGLAYLSGRKGTIARLKHHYRRQM